MYHLIRVKPFKSFQKFMANEQESCLISINGLEAVLNHDSHFIKFLRLVNSLKIGIKLWRN